MRFYFHFYFFCEISFRYIYLCHGNIVIWISIGNNTKMIWVLKDVEEVCGFGAIYGNKKVMVEVNDEIFNLIYFYKGLLVLLILGLSVNYEEYWSMLQKSDEYWWFKFLVFKNQSNHCQIYFEFLFFKNFLKKFKLTRFHPFSAHS